jgi:hypothetical protein
VLRDALYHIEHTTWINNRFVPWSVVVVVVIVVVIVMVVVVVVVVVVVW